MSGATNYVSSDGTHPNDNNTTIYSSSPSDGVAAGAYQWIQCVCIESNRVRHDNIYFFFLQKE